MKDFSLFLLPVSSFALTWCHSGIRNEIFEWPTLCQNLARAVYSVMGAHLGSVQIQRHAKSFSLSSPFPLRRFVRPCVCLSPSPSLSLVVNGDVKYLNTLCCAGTMHSSRWTGPARVGCMQISIQSSPGCFQSNTSASGPVLIPLYPQPARFFIKSNAVSAVSTWTSGPTTKPEGEQDRRVSVGERIWLAWNIWRWVWDIERLREMSKGLCGIVLELLNKSSLTLLLHSAASVEIRAREAFVCLGGKHVAEMLSLSLSLSFLHCFFFPCRFLLRFQKEMSDAGGCRVWMIAFWCDKWSREQPDTWRHLAPRHRASAPSHRHAHSVYEHSLFNY